MSERKLGIIGGLSWVSTLHYYRRINELVGAVRGRQHSANLLISSLDFQPVIDAQVKGQWDFLGARLAQEARNLEQCGSSAHLIASNTMHLVQAHIERGSGSELLSIFDAVTTAANLQSYRTLGLLGTRYTMAHPFFIDQYAKRGVSVKVPSSAAQKHVNEVIFTELIHSRCSDRSVEVVRKACVELQNLGCDAILLGCTELTMLTPMWSAEIPYLDSAETHCQLAARWLEGTA